MAGITIYEFDTVLPQGAGGDDPKVPSGVFNWLEGQCLRITERGEGAWLRLTARRGHRAVQVTSFVGVLRAPDGFQIEVLPKAGRAIGGGAKEARKLLIDMLRCLNGFRHIQTDRAQLAATRMPLLEVFISEFLSAVQCIVKRGLRSDYTIRQDNIFALRGKLLVGPHLRINLCRSDRFFTEHEEFSPNRAENRLLRAALRRTLSISTMQANQQMARELCFVFADVPMPIEVAQDFQRVRPDRGMGYYSDALAWARLILNDEAPLTGVGEHQAPSLLFPMEALFEAYVARHIQNQLVRPFSLKSQASSHSLVRHKGQSWFRLKPDLLVREPVGDLMVLDVKWKLLDALKANGYSKYGLAQSDFYQLHAYGHNYLNGEGDVILIYPKTENFREPLPVFEFPKATGLRLWVLPFCLKAKALMVPDGAPFAKAFDAVV